MYWCIYRTWSYFITSNPTKIVSWGNVACVQSSEAVFAKLNMAGGIIYVVHFICIIFHDFWPFLRLVYIGRLVKWFISTASCFLWSSWLVFVFGSDCGVYQRACRHGAPPSCINEPKKLLTGCSFEEMRTRWRRSLKFYDCEQVLSFQQHLVNRTFYRPPQPACKLTHFRSHDLKV